MLSLRNRLPAALALSLALALPVFAAPVPSEPPAGTYEKYLPDDADGVIVVNVRQLLDSELIKKAGLDKALAGDEAAQQGLKALGLDPLKDIDRVVVSGAATQGLVIVQGQFDPAKLSAAAEAAAKEHKDNLTIHKTDNGKIYELTKLDELVKLPGQAAQATAGLKGNTVYAAIADKGNIVLSNSKDAVADVQAKAAGKKTTTLKRKDLAALIAKINPKQSVSVVLLAPAGTEEKVKSITGGITVTADVTTDVKVVATDADAAKEVNDKIAEQLKTVQDLAGFLVIQEKGLAPIIDVLAGIKHEAKDNAVTITSEVKGETVEKLAKAAAELAAKAAGSIK